MVREQWSELPQDLLALLMKRIATSIEDVVRFRAVSRAWQSQDLLAELLNSQEKTPFLLMQKEGSPGLTVFCPSSERSYELEVPQLLLDPNIAICGSSGGWLATYDRQDTTKQINLVDPLTGYHISLPPFPFSQDIKIVWSSNPTSSSCTAMAIVKDNPNVTIVKPGDESWQLMMIPWKDGRWPIDIIHFNDRFYVLYNSGMIMELDIHSQPPQAIGVAFHHDDRFWYWGRYLVEMFEKLLYVTVGHSYITQQVEIISFEIKGLEKDGPCELVTFDGLGEGTLFLSQFSSSGPLTSQNGSSKCMKICMYLNDMNLLLTSLHSYSMDNGGVTVTFGDKKYSKQRWAARLELNVAQVYLRLLN